MTDRLEHTIISYFNNFNSLEDYSNNRYDSKFTAATSAVFHGVSGMQRISLASEMHKLIKQIDTKTNGQAKIMDYDTDDLRNFSVVISPKGGHYANGKFVFQVCIPRRYPHRPPEVVCVSDIYHPNIDEDGYICLNLFSDWTAAFGLEDVIQGVIFLFYQPNLMDPVSCLFNEPLTEEQFRDNVQSFMRGEVLKYGVLSVQFSPNPGYVEYETKMRVQIQENDAVEDMQEPPQQVEQVEESSPETVEEVSQLTITMEEDILVVPKKEAEAESEAEEEASEYESGAVVFRESLSGQFLHCLIPPHASEYTEDTDSDNDDDFDEDDDEFDDDDDEFLDTYEIIDRESNGAQSAAESVLKTCLSALETMQRFAEPDIFTLPSVNAAASVVSYLQYTLKI